MLDTQVASRITRAVEAAFDEQVALTADLVAAPSVMGEEAGAQALMADAMAAAGLDVDRWSLAEADLSALHGYGKPLVDYADSWNVVGAHRSTAGGRSLILNGHIDVVPTGPAERWTTPPFSPRIEDGWLYGRGAGDMKAGLVASVFAYDAVRRAGFVPKGDVFVESVVEEECTGNGSLACVQRGYIADAAVFPEPTQCTTVTSQVGLLWFQIRVAGDPQHASKAGRTVNAIDKAYGLYRSLQALEDGWNARKDEYGFARHDHPVNILLGQIAGGDWPSSVPAWCTLDLRVGVFPGIPASQIRADIEACVASAAADDPYLRVHPPEVVWHGHFGEGYALQDGDDFLAVLQDTHAGVFGAQPFEIAAAGSSDARVLGGHSIPSILYGPTARNIHGFDEAVELASVRTITTSLALFIAEWCGIEEVA